MSSYQDMEDEIDSLLKDKRELINENRALQKELKDSINNTTSAEIWLRCFTARMVNESSISCNASYANKALEEYMKRYGKDVNR